MTKPNSKRLRYLVLFLLTVSGCGLLPRQDKPVARQSGQLTASQASTPPAVREPQSPVEALPVAQPVEEIHTPPAILKQQSGEIVVTHRPEVFLPAAPIPPAERTTVTTTTTTTTTAGRPMRPVVDETQTSNPAEATFREILKTPLTPSVSPPRQDQPAYRGPAEGAINWSGQLEKNGVVTIDGAAASSGTLSGRLPGVPVLVEFDSREFAMAEAPGPSNHWSRFTIRSRNRRHTVITIRWSIVQ